MDIPSMISLGIGILGVVIAFYQGFEKKKLSEHLQSQAWYIYSLALMSSIATQIALKTYKEAHKDKIDNAVLEHLSKSDTYNVSIFLESIRQIHLSEPKFTIENIGTWILQGKIAKEHAPYFIRMMSMDAPNFICLIFRSFILRIKKKLLKPITPYSDQQNSQNNSNVEQTIRKP